MLGKEPYLSLGDDCFLDLAKEIMVKDDFPVALSRIQFRILYYLGLNLGIPVTNQELIRFAWGEDSFISVGELYVYINRIRQRLEDDRRKPQYLFCLRGVGYVLYPRTKL